MRNAFAALALSLLLIFAGHADAAEPDKGPQPQAADPYEKAKGDALDAYIAGRLTTAYALSEHLSPYELGVNVKDGHVRLSGVVENRVQRDLAIEIARGIEQARVVESDIRVDPDRARSARSPSRSGFVQAFADAGITAQVKSRLLINGSTGGLAIDVDTEQRAVALSGEVGSSAESALAEQIARNTQGVSAVDNRLTVARGAAAAAAALISRRSAYR